MTYPLNYLKKFIKRIGIKCRITINWKQVFIATLSELNCLIFFESKWDANFIYTALGNESMQGGLEYPPERERESEVHPTPREGNELDRRFQRLRPARRGRDEGVRGERREGTHAHAPPTPVCKGWSAQAAARAAAAARSVRENPREITLAQSRAAVTSRRTLAPPAPRDSLRQHTFPQPESADDAADLRHPSTFTTGTIGEYGFGADLASATVKSHGRNK